MPSSPSPPFLMCSTPFLYYCAKLGRSIWLLTSSLFFPSIYTRVAALSSAQEAMLAAVSSLLTDHLFRSPGQGVASQVRRLSVLSILSICTPYLAPLLVGHWSL